jgi:hypothetical protein
MSDLRSAVDRLMKQQDWSTATVQPEPSAAKAAAAPEPLEPSRAVSLASRRRDAAGRKAFTASAPPPPRPTGRTSWWLNASRDRFTETAEHNVAADPRGSKLPFRG